MYEHNFQHSVTFLQNGSSHAMTHPEYFWQMMVVLADDIFVPEVRGISRLAPYEHKNYSQTQTQLSFS
jgi:hypothetical protein